MQGLDLVALIAVIGAGQSTTRLDVGPVHYRHTTTDYQVCVGAMRSAAARQYPNTSVWPFTPDTNAAARARTEAASIGRYCGRPRR